MAHAFSITDGTTTFSLTATNALLVNYDMGTPRKGEPSVADTVELLIYGTTGALMQTAVRTLQSLLDSAHRRQEWKAGPRVYVQAQLDTDGSVWRSEILAGNLELNENSLAVWANLKFEARLMLERVPYWEGARTQATLTNANGTDNTAGLTIYNHNDAGVGHDNYASINSTEITGDLPTPLEIQLTNTSGAARSWQQFWIAVNAFNDPGNMAYILEGEDRVAGYGTITADAGSSGGNYNAATNSGTVYMYWEMVAGLLADCAGYPFRILVRFTEPLPTGFVSVIVTTPDSTTVLYQGDELALAASGQTSLVDLGVVPLPPGGYATAYGALRLGLKFRFATSQTAGVDFVQLTPAYSCRDLFQRGGAIANGEVVVCDEIEQRYYSTDATNDWPYYIPRGGPVTAWPGRVNNIYTLITRQTGSMVIADTCTIKAWFRPRRLNV